MCISETNETHAASCLPHFRNVASSAAFVNRCNSVRQVLVIDEGNKILYNSQNHRARQDTEGNIFANLLRQLPLRSPGIHMECDSTTVNGEDHTESEYWRLSITFNLCRETTFSYWFFVCWPLHYQPEAYENQVLWSTCKQFNFLLCFHFQKYYVTQHHIMLNAFSLDTFNWNNCSPPRFWRLP